MRLLFLFLCGHARPAAAAIAIALVTFTPAHADPNAPVLLVVGDSLSAGYGIAKGTGWVDLLVARIDAQHLPWRVVNASISGDTTAGGRARLPSLLAQHKPGVVIVELGANDGLRGGNLRSTKDNLDAMIAAVRKAGAKPIVVGMKLPPNYGPAYTREFDALFGDVARANNAALVPFFFAGFAESEEWFQQDRVHPTAAAQSKLLDNVWPVLSPLLAKPR
jgi:acyl-CoA thioesterase-1